MACEKPGIPEIPLKFSLKVEIIWESYYNRFSSLLCQSCLTKVTVNCLRDKRLLKALHNSNKCNVYIRGTICLFTAASCWNKFDEICWVQRFIFVIQGSGWCMSSRLEIEECCWEPQNTNIELLLALDDITAKHVETCCLLTDCRNRISTSFLCPKWGL